MRRFEYSEKDAKDICIYVLDKEVIKKFKDLDT